MITYWVWISFREIRGADAHSNYALPFHPLRLLRPVYGGPTYHSIHHAKGTRDSNCELVCTCAAGPHPLVLRRLQFDLFVTAAALLSHVVHMIRDLTFVIPLLPAAQQTGATYSGTGSWARRSTRARRTREGRLG